MHMTLYTHVEEYVLMCMHSCMYVREREENRSDKKMNTQVHVHANTNVNTAVNTNAHVHRHDIEMQVCFYKRSTYMNDVKD